MKKISKVLLTIFSVGVIATLFAGGLAFVGYVVALVIGGEAATELCVFIHKEYFPWVIKICSISTGLGLIGMYLSKKKALSVENTENTAKSEEQS